MTIKRITLLFFFACAYAAPVTFARQPMEGRSQPPDNENSNPVSPDCQEVQNYATEWYETGKMAAAEKDYYAAYVLYGHALDYLTSFSDCCLEEESIENEQSAISLAYAYQNLLLEFRSLAWKSDYAAALAKFRDAEAFFDSNAVYTFGLERPDLAAFAAANCTDDFLHYLFDYYVARNEIDRAELMIKTLAAHGYADFHSMAGNFRRLGRLVGLHDLHKGQKENPKSYLENYFHDLAAYPGQESQLYRAHRIVRAFSKGYREGLRKRNKKIALLLT